MTFVRREWQPLAIFGGGFAAIYLFAILSVSPAYFYPRLITDSINYYLKALAFIETGHTAARIAVNLPPFTYLSMPGLLRVPVMIFFRDFDDQQRAIQISNVLLVGVTAAMYAYVLSWIVPRRWHWLAIGFSFAFMLLNPDWGGNVFALLADAPYAAVTIAFLIFVTRVLTSNRPLTGQPWAIAGCLVLFALAFLCRFSAPVLLVYVAVFAIGRQIHRRSPRWPLVAGAIVSVLVVAILIGLNWQTLMGRYLMEPVQFILRANKASVAMNFLATALPSQIVPRFQRGFTHDPVLDTYHVYFGHAPRDAVLVAIGFLISATTFYGMWRARHRFIPEIAYVLAALPVLVMVIPSTARYLIAYEPFLWIFFYAGASALLAPVASRIAPSPRALFVTVAVLAMTVSTTIYLRSRAAGSNGRFSIGETRAYSAEVASTFGGLRSYLETLPRDHTYLIARATAGRWKAISGLDYYRPDSLLPVAVVQRDTYLLLECATRDSCRNFDDIDRRFPALFNRYGQFSFDPVFARSTEHAKAKVYRIRDSQ